MSSLRQRGWSLFDQIVAEAPLRDVSPWRDGPGFRVDHDTLRRLLAVPVHLGAGSQSGVPALALDVWVAYELRRAGFDPDKVWPRATEPRVLPTEIARLLDDGVLTRPTRAALLTEMSRGLGGAVSASANLLGKNYVKQVDVVMSAWHTGPELMISTKRMDSSFGKNAANRVEESYGDAKNLRLRHPQAALGFVYALNARAFTEEPDRAAWLVDLLGKLGREDDAYDAVALIVPQSVADPLHGDDGDDDAEPDPLSVSESGDAPTVGPLVGTAAGPGDLFSADLTALPQVDLLPDRVPADLDPGRFFDRMVDRVLAASPINFHAEARRRRSAGG